jgi:hypothetical protein
MKRTQVQEWQEMIVDCEDRESLLSEWETNFIESIDEQLAERGSLSSKQVEILEKIWNKITEAG